LANYTTNYNLKKPASTDTYNIDDFNNNADIVDTKLWALDAELSNIKTELGVIPIDGGTFFEVYTEWENDGGTF